MPTRPQEDLGPCPQLRETRRRCWASPLLWGPLGQVHRGAADTFPFHVLISPRPMVSDPGEAGSEGEGCQRSAPSLVATGRAGGEDMVARGAGTCLRTPVLQDQGFPGRGGLWGGGVSIRSPTWRGSREVNPSPDQRLSTTFLQDAAEEATTLFLLPGPKCSS